ncbi:MAG: hypothetical protein Q8P07_00285 [bacterium]|nr:hypothetical protein [bacterium]
METIEIGCIDQAVLSKKGGKLVGDGKEAVDHLAKLFINASNGEYSNDGRIELVAKEHVIVLYRSAGLFYFRVQKK